MKRFSTLCLFKAHYGEGLKPRNGSGKSAKGKGVKCLVTVSFRKPWIPKFLSYRAFTFVKIFNLRVSIHENVYRRACVTRAGDVDGNSLVDGTERAG